MKANKMKPGGILCLKRPFFLPIIQIKEIFNKKFADSLGGLCNTLKGF